MYFRYNNINLYYEKYGNLDDIIVILPGWGDTRKSFYYLINILKNFYTIYIVDYPGFGNSAFPDFDLTIYDYAILINEWIKSLKIKDATFIGHSFGGRILIVLNGYYQLDYRNIILMSSAGIKQNKKFRNIVRKFIYKTLIKSAVFLPKKIRKKYINKIFSYFASDDYKNLNENMRNTFKNIVNEDLKKYLKNMSGNINLIWGDKDLSTPLKDGLLMNKLIDKSSIYIIENATHYVYLDDPIEVIKKIDDLIENIKSS